MNGHEGGAGEERARERPHHVAVQPVDGIDERQQAIGQPVGDALDAQNEAGAQVSAEGVAVDELSFHGADSSGTIE